MFTLRGCYMIPARVTPKRAVDFSKREIKFITARQLGVFIKKVAILIALIYMSEMTLKYHIREPMYSILRLYGMFTIPRFAKNFFDIIFPPEPVEEPKYYRVEVPDRGFIYVNRITTSPNPGKNPASGTSLGLNITKNGTLRSFQRCPI